MSQNSLSYVPSLLSPRTPRFNMYQSSSRTFNPSSPILSLTYLNSEKALTTPQHLKTLPSSTTSFGVMKSDKNIVYNNTQQKQNLRYGDMDLGSMGMNGLKNVNEIESEFKKIIEEFQNRKQELERNFSSPFEVETQQNPHQLPNFGSSESYDVIKEITEEYNTSTAEDFNPQINYDIHQNLVDQGDIWERINHNKSKQIQGEVDHFYMNTFGNVGWAHLDTNKGNRDFNTQSYSNTAYPFYIIDLKLPDKSDQLVYIPSVPVSQFAAHVVEKHNINPEHTSYIQELIESQIKSAARV